MNDKCKIPFCRDEGEVNYLGKWLCDKHWTEVCVATAPEQYMESE